MTSAALAASAHQTLNRYEVKYLVDTRRIPTLLAEVAPYTRPDPHSPEWGYPIHSVYWDTDDLRFFWEKIEGLKTRRKLRFRRYADSDEVYVEIKQRLDRTLHKRRIKLPLAAALDGFGQGEHSMDWSAFADDVVATEIAMMIERHHLRPRMAIRYRRRALFGAFDPELRVTFDGRLRYHPTDLSLATPFDGGHDIIDTRLSVMEIKYDHRAPTWLTKTIRRHGLEMVRMSKYCSAVDKHLFDGENTW